jgi:hypothetical protein
LSGRRKRSSACAPAEQPAQAKKRLESSRHRLKRSALRFISHGKHDIRLSGGASRLGFGPKRLIRHAAYDRKHAQRFSGASHQAKASL